MSGAGAAHAALAAPGFGPSGQVVLTARQGRIIRLRWHDESGRGDGVPTTATADPPLPDALVQLSAYFAGALRRFDLPLALGTGFQGDVLAALLAIPFGETRTYGDIARALGASAQAVGQACGANPIPVLVPCHRVVAAHGLGGYSGAGGIETKVALLRHEGAAALLL